MLKKIKTIVKVCLVLGVILALWPVMLSAAPPPPVVDYPTLELPQAQDDVWTMYSSYEWLLDSGPSRCPDPPVFKHGTREVHSYIPAYFKQQTAATALWYMLDEEGNPTSEEPIASGQAVFNANTMPYTTLSLGKGVKGVIGVYFFVEDGEDWILIGQGMFGIAYAGVEAPAPGGCPMPEGAGTGGDTGSAPAQPQAPLTISWSPQMTYEGRQGDSRWCQFSMTYQNDSGQTYRWPDYRPAILLVNGDGSVDGWYFANYYAKEDGWENGIEGTPPPIPDGASADWTWYIATGGAGQYCGAAGIMFGEWAYLAYYNAQGALEGTEISPPE